MNVFVVCAEGRDKQIYILAVCDSMKTVIEKFGTSWYERVTVSTCEINEVTPKFAVV